MFDSKYTRLGETEAGKLVALSELKTMLEDKSFHKGFPSTERGISILFSQPPQLSHRLSLLTRQRRFGWLP